MDVLGKPIGKQDAYAGALGGMNLIEFKPDGTRDQPSRSSPRRSTSPPSTAACSSSTRARPRQSGDDVLANQGKAASDGVNVEQMIADARPRLRDARPRSRAATIEAIADLLHRNWELKRTLGAGHLATTRSTGCYDRAREAGGLGRQAAGRRRRRLLPDLRSRPTRSARSARRVSELPRDPVPLRGARSPPAAAGAGLMAIETDIRAYLDRLLKTLDGMPVDAIATLSELLYRAYSDDKQVFILGNGGSASTASHMAADLGKNTIGPNMRRFRIMSLNDNIPLLTALSNDLGYENMFAEQLQNLIQRRRRADRDLRLGQVAERAQGDGVRAQPERRGRGAARLRRRPGDRAGRHSIVLIDSSDYGVVEDAHLIINHILVEHFRQRLAEEQPWST